MTRFEKAAAGSLDCFEAMGRESAMPDAVAREHHCNFGTAAWPNSSNLEGRRCGGSLRFCGGCSGDSKGQGNQPEKGWAKAPVVRALREVLSYLNQRLQELGVDEVVERAGAPSRDDAYRPMAAHCAHPICQTLGYPIGSWGVS